MRLAPDYPIVTERLRLRPLTLDDTEALHAYRSLPEVCRYVPFTPMSPEVITERILGNWSRTTIENEGEGLTLGVELAAERRVIGDVILFFRSAEDRGGEVGWVLNPDYGGQGYATEAADEVLRLAFEEFGLHRVVARVDGRNVASQRLCTRLGMRREAHLISNEWFKGEWTDEIDFAMLDAEWTARQARR